MGNKDIRETILNALAVARGDDLERAKVAFKGMSLVQMQRQFGLSGKTCAVVLAEYEAHAKKIEEATRWVKGNCR